MAPPAPDTPRALAQLWQEPDATGKRRRYGLNRADIVRAAIEIADADGPDAVSMANVENTILFVTEIVVVGRVRK